MIANTTETKGRLFKCRACGYVTDEPIMYNGIRCGDAFCGGIADLLITNLKKDFGADNKRGARQHNLPPLQRWNLRKDLTFSVSSLNYIMENAFNITVAILLFLLAILFAGEPDLMDGITKALLKSYVIY